MAKLTPRQEAFVREYLVDLNATRAAIRAGYSARTADKIGPQLLGKTSVQQAVREALQARSLRTDLTADDVLRGLAELAQSDIGDILDFTGDALALRCPSQISGAARRCIQSVKVRRVLEGTGDEKTPVDLIEFRLADKLSAYDKLARHLGMYRDAGDKDGDDPLLRRLEQLLTERNELLRSSAASTGTTPSATPGTSSE